MAKAVIISGAGLSAESGIPTFRDTDGLWSKYDMDVVANFCTFESNRVPAFEFFNVFRRMLKDAQPNAAHIAIAQLQKQYGTGKICIITQNVDDLLERAGCRDVVHVHGYLTEMQCLDCHHVWDIGYEDCAPYSFCPQCSSLYIKPNVVLFNEIAPKYTDMYKIIDGLTGDDCFVALGTSGTVIPVRGFIYGFTGPKILCNLEPSPDIDGKLFDYCYYQPVTHVIDKIVRHVEKALTKKRVSIKK